MRKIRYSKDVDALLIELSDKKIDYAEEEGQMIIHFSKEGEPTVNLFSFLSGKRGMNLMSSVSSRRPSGHCLSTLAFSVRHCVPFLI